MLLQRIRFVCSRRDWRHFRMIVSQWIVCGCQTWPCSSSSARPTSSTDPVSGSVWRANHSAAASITRWRWRRHRTRTHCPSMSAPSDRGLPTSVNSSIPSWSPIPPTRRYASWVVKQRVKIVYFSMLVIRLEAPLQPNIGFTLRRVLAVFTHSAITPPKVGRFGWNLAGALWVHCRGLALADFGRDPRSSASWRAKRNFLSG